MQADLSKRIGNLSGGVMDIKSHAWFKTLDWEACLTKRMSAPIRYYSLCSLADSNRGLILKYPVLPPVSMSNNLQTRLLSIIINRH